MSNKKLKIDIPTGALIYGNGYVYINIESQYSPKLGYTTSKRKCIGRKIDNTTSMYANKYYMEALVNNKKSLPPTMADSIQVGNFTLFKELSSSKGVDEALQVFNEANASFIKDLALYLLLESTSVFQHYPTYTYSNQTFNGVVMSDTTVSNLLKTQIPYTKIEGFLNKWASLNRGDGTAYICYDLTNMNCMSEGVTLAEMGHAKDDTTKLQVNVEYVIRQSDGLPLLFDTYSGSIVDITQGSSTIKKIHELGYDNIIIVADKGYISRDNIIVLDESNIGFLLMIRSNLVIYKKLIDKYYLQLKYSNRYYIDSNDIYGMTVTKELYGKDRFFHIFFSPATFDMERQNFNNKIKRLENSLKTTIADELIISRKDEKKYRYYFELEIEEDSRILKSYTIIHDAIDAAIDKLGFFVLVSSNEISVREALDVYNKRDCVEKSFRGVKTGFDLDTFRVHSTGSIESKMFIAFIASIYRSVLFYGLSELREKNNKSFTVPAAIRELSRIYATRDYNSQEYRRRYQLTSKQKAIFKAFNLNENDVDNAILSIEL